ncbi:MAG: hypothetical protein GXP47_06020 [Acidobacteria bacterium]|nr:hypothetical protein [Acidobacteriota bacterium]
MGRKNVTLTLDEEILRKARIMAAMEGRSLSALLREQLGRLVDDRRTRLEALVEIEDLLDRPRARIGGTLPSREELHER